jgi:hypothetical protein
MILSAIAWWNSISPNVQAVIISVTASFVVTWFVRRGENVRFEKKLRHESQESKVEREMEMKRDVFMTVCDGIARGSVFLAKYADFEMATKDHQALINDAAPGLYRLHLSGNDVTLARLVAMQEFLATRGPALQEERLTIELEKVDLQRMEYDIKQRVEGRQQFIVQMQENNPPLKDNIEIQRSVMTQIARLNTEIKDFENRASELNKATFLKQLELASNSHRASIQYEELGTDLILAMRDELGFKIDATKYTTNLSEARKKAIVRIDESIPKIRDAVTKRAFPVPSVGPKVN